MTVLAYGALVKGTTAAGRADLDAYIDGRELPSVVKARVEKRRAEHESAEWVLAHAAELGGEIG